MQKVPHANQLISVHDANNESLRRVLSLNLTIMEAPELLTATAGAALAAAGAVAVGARGRAS